MVAGAVTVATVLASAISASPSLAQTGAPTQASVQLQSERSFDIPAQPLTDALVAFGQQSGIQVTVDGAAVRDATSPAVRGTMSSEEALRRLLAGSGLTYTMSGATVAIERLGQTGGGATVLGPITVEGQQPPRRARLGDRPEAYAGGQVARGGTLGILGTRDVLDTPFNQTSYTAKLMEDQQVHHVEDVVRNDPSVIVTGPASSGISGFNIRGFKSVNSDILFNGMSLVLPTFASSMTMDGFERVDVLKGPNALLTGIGASGSIGGTINLVPKRAGDEPLTQFTGSYATHSQVGGHLDIGRRYGDDKELGVRLNASYRDGETAIDKQSSETRLAMLGLDLQKDRVTVETDLGYQRWTLNAPRNSYAIANGVALPDAPDASSNHSPSWEFFQTEAVFGALRGEVEVTPNVAAFASVGGNRRYQRRAVSSRTIVDAQGNLSPGTGTIRAGINQGLTTEFGVRANLETGPVDHELTAAYIKNRWTWERVRDVYAFPASNIYSPVLYESPANTRLDFDDAGKLEDLEFTSFVLADTLSILDERVQLTGGVRHQRVERTGYNERTSVVTSEYDETVLTPMVGLVVKPRPDTSLYANYIEGLEQGGTAPIGTTNEGEVFAPYVTEQYEVGVKWDTGRLGASLAGYQISLPEEFTDPATNTFVVDGTQRHRGLEFNVFGEASEGLRLLGGVSYIHSELLDTAGGVNDGNRSLGVPKLRGVLGGEWDTPFFQGLTLTARVTGQTSAYIDAGNTRKADAWRQVDVGARYAIERTGGEPIVIRANIDNLFDTAYWNARDQGGVNLSEPFTFKLSTSFKF